MAEFSDPFAVAASADGRLYVADGGDANLVRRIEADGTVVTLAGGSGEGWRDGRRGLAAFHTPSGLALAADGSLFVADTGTHVVRRISPDGVVTTVAGNGSPGYGDGAGTSAAFDGPMGLALAPDGRLFVADAYNHRIRAIDRGGTVSTIAGTGAPGFADGSAAAAEFDTPCGVAIGPDGVIYVADTGNGSIRRIVPTGDVSTMTLVAAEPSDDVSLVRPIGIAAGKDGRLVVSDRRGRVLQVWPDGTARLLGGSLARLPGRRRATSPIPRTGRRRDRSAGSRHRRRRGQLPAAADRTGRPVPAGRPAQPARAPAGLSERAPAGARRSRGRSSRSSSGTRWPARWARRAAARRTAGSASMRGWTCRPTRARSSAPSGARRSTRRSRRRASAT